MHNNFTNGHMFQNLVTEKNSPPSVNCFLVPGASQSPVPPYTGKTGQNARASNKLGRHDIHSERSKFL